MNKTQTRPRSFQSIGGRGEPVGQLQSNVLSAVRGQLTCLGGSEKAPESNVAVETQMTNSSGSGKGAKSLPGGNCMQKA